MQTRSLKRQDWTVVDLFSGAGGMSYGFHAHPMFNVVAAVDAQIGKPSSKAGSLDCNLTYKANMGVEPLCADIGRLEGEELRDYVEGKTGGSSPTVLISCAPCTGFTRTVPTNHLADDPRNSLVTRSAEFVQALRPAIFLMENARELIKGKFSHHYQSLRASLTKLGYKVHGSVHVLSKFGLPQIRERALIIAVHEDLPLYTLEDLWSGLTVVPEAVTVRRTIEHLPPVTAGEKLEADPLHTAPSFGDAITLRRMQLMPKDGGSWADLRYHPEREQVLIPSMLRAIAKGDFGSHPDVYGRLWWDRPAVTIKRECAHVGNGRYAHPEQDRLCTVREMALLQGFPADYQFTSTGLSNMYRHIGDAVPPLISYQIARVCEWVLTGRKPDVGELVLPGTQLTERDILGTKEEVLQLSIL